MSPRVRRRYTYLALIAISWLAIAPVIGQFLLSSFPQIGDNQRVEICPVMGVMLVKADLIDSHSSVDEHSLDLHADDPLSSPDSTASTQKCPYCHFHGSSILPIIEQAWLTLAPRPVELTPWYLLPARPIDLPSATLGARGPPLV